MNLEKQCCTLEQGKKLLQLGVRNESLGCFIGDPNPDPAFHIPYKFLSYEEAYHECGSSWFHSRIPAYSVAELGVMLPDEVDHQNIFTRATDGAFGEKGRQFFGSLPERLHMMGARTEASMRAAILIDLIQRNKVLVKDINKRLAKA